MIKDNLRRTDEITEFNHSLAILERIDTLIKGLHDSNMDGRWLDSAKTLKAIYRELHPVLNKDERKELKADYDELRKLINCGCNFSKLNLTRGEMLDFFDYFEEKERYFIQEHGMGLKKKDDARFGM